MTFISGHAPDMRGYALRTVDCSVSSSVRGRISRGVSTGRRTSLSTPQNVPSPTQRCHRDIALQLPVLYRIGIAPNREASGPHRRLFENRLKVRRSELSTLVVRSRECEDLQTPDMNDKQTSRRALVVHAQQAHSYRQSSILEDAYVYVDWLPAAE